MWIHSWVKVHSAPLCRDVRRGHMCKLYCICLILVSRATRTLAAMATSRTELIHCSEMHSYAHTRTHYILHGYTYTLNYPDTHTHTHLQGEWFPAGVLQQCRGGAQSVLWPLLQREDDSTRILTETVDQILQLPAHLKDRDDLEIKTKYNQINNVKLP